MCDKEKRKKNGRDDGGGEEFTCELGLVWMTEALFESLLKKLSLVLVTLTVEDSLRMTANSKIRED